MESFVVCQRFKGEPYMNLPLNIGGYVDVRDLVDSDTREDGEETLDPSFIPFIACGDLSGWSYDGEVLDSDKSYPVEVTDEGYIPPVAPPIEPPYQTSLAKQKEERSRRA
jgi:hypothetical protein